MHIRPALLEDIPALQVIRDNVRENARVALAMEHAADIKALTEEGRAWTCEVDGEPVGFVCARPTHKDIWALCVRADHESKGIGDALMDVAEQWMFARGVDELHVSTAAGTRADRLFARRGWQRQRMVRGDAVFTLPRRVSIRAATAEDARAIGALHVAAWQWAYRGLIDQQYLDALDPLARGEQWRESLAARAGDSDERTWVAWDGDELVGLCHTTRARAAAASAAFEAGALYVAQRVAGTNVSARLFLRAVREVERRGATTVFLWVLASNLRARRFYEKHGFKPDGATKLDEEPGRPALFEVRYVRRR